MKPSEVKIDYWYCAAVEAEHIWRFRTEHVFAVGARGYINLCGRNNLKDPNEVPAHFKVLLRNQKNAIVGFWLSAKEAEKILRVTVPAPGQRRVDGLWSAHFAVKK